MRPVGSFLFGFIFCLSVLPSAASTISPLATNPDDTRFHGTQGPVKLTYPNPVFTASQFSSFELIATVQNTLDYSIAIRASGIGAVDPLGLGVIADPKSLDDVFGPFTIAAGETFTGSFAKMAIEGGVPPGAYTNQFANFDYCPVTDSPCQVGVNTTTQTVYENYTVVITPGVPPSGGDGGDGGTGPGQEVPEPSTCFLALSGFAGLLVSKRAIG